MSNNYHNKKYKPKRQLQHITEKDIPSILRLIESRQIRSAYSNIKILLERLNLLKRDL